MNIASDLSYSSVFQVTLQLRYKVISTPGQVMVSSLLMSHDGHFLLVMPSINDSSNASFLADRARHKQVMLCRPKLRNPGMAICETVLDTLSRFSHSQPLT